VDFTMDLGAGRASPHSAVHVRPVQRRGNGLLFDYRRRGLETRYNYKTSPASVLYGS